MKKKEQNLTKKELEQLYRNFQIIEKYDFELYKKLLAKFYVEVLPIINSAPLTRLNN